MAKKNRKKRKILVECWSWMVFIHVCICMYYLNKIQNVISILLFTFLNLDIGYSLQWSQIHSFLYFSISSYWNPLKANNTIRMALLSPPASIEHKKSLWNSSHSVELHKEALRKKEGINEWKEICKRYDTLVHTYSFHFSKWLYQMNLNGEESDFPSAKFLCD